MGCGWPRMLTIIYDGANHDAYTWPSLSAHSIEHDATNVCFHIYCYCPESSTQPSLAGKLPFSRWSSHFSIHALGQIDRKPCQNCLHGGKSSPLALIQV